MEKFTQRFHPDTSSSPIPAWRQWLFRRIQKSPGRGKTQFGDLRRLTPISRHFGYDRGLPIDRYYIENFLHQNEEDIRGRVLEIGDDSYTRQFGGRRVLQRDVLHVKENNPIATFVGDLTHADHIPPDSFDCFILTQTLHLVYELRAAMATIYRILKPGGVLLCTVPGISHKSVDEWEEYWCWAFTKVSIKKLFGEFFPDDHLNLECYGNVLSTIAFLEGLSFDELSQNELDYQDQSYEMLIAIRAVKPQQS